MYKILSLKNIRRAAFLVIISAVVLSVFLNLHYRNEIGAASFTILV